jgi:hypothetical protein
MNENTLEKLKKKRKKSLRRKLKHPKENKWKE